ncbi:MAG: RNA methyltransferase [candidate division KSB1 bacterium]|nr:RNA methyltransferase [candidate division KSB1 bacterium]
MEQLEGRICVQAALQARQRKITLLVIRSGLHGSDIQSLLEEAERQNIPVKFAAATEIEAMAQGKTHGGVIALATPKPPLTAEALLERIKRLSHPPALLLLEGIDDSQNLGFTLRSAEALGIDAILLKKHLWDFDSTAVSRASSGAYERMPITLLDQVEKVLPKFKSLALKLFGCIANAKQTMYQVDLTQPVMLAIGGEKRGLSAAVRSQCDSFIKIPMMTDIGSLSLSHSASILMAELMRQRLFLDL